MTIVTVEQFFGAAVEWAQNRNGQFQYYWPVKGGWEAWIQVDLTGYILARDSTIEIMREQPIFANPRQRVDLLLNTTLQTDDQVAVEIKAESFENRMNPFIAGIREDIRKLNEDRNSDYSECVCIMMALPFSPESLSSVLEITENGHRIFQTIYKGEVAIACALYTEQTGWIPAGQDLRAVAPALFPGVPLPTAPGATTQASTGVLP